MTCNTLKRATRLILALATAGSTGASLAEPKSLAGAEATLSAPDQAPDPRWSTGLNASNNPALAGYLVDKPPMDISGQIIGKTNGILSVRATDQEGLAPTGPLLLLNCKLAGSGFPRVCVLTGYPGYEQVNVGDRIHAAFHLLVHTDSAQGCLLKGLCFSLQPGAGVSLKGQAPRAAGRSYRVQGWRRGYRTDPYETLRCARRLLSDWVGVPPAAGPSRV
ncbi:exported hypothetical protein [Verrucomicrobia bacterium]|nr:exported hypothetical protein [Verrucomicrobiota bacterium]